MEVVLNESEERALGATVGALDRLITDPHDHEELKVLRAEVPQWLSDQIEAAIVDAARQATRGIAIGRAINTRALAARDHAVWVRHGALETLVLWIGGKAATCVHSPSPRRAQPIYAAAWRPRLVVCGQCTALLAKPHWRDAEHYCEGCTYEGTSPLDLTTAERPRLSGVQFGVLTYSFGTCPAHRYWE